MIKLIEINEITFENIGDFMSAKDITKAFNNNSIKVIDLRDTNVSDNIINIGEEVTAEEINEVVNNNI